MKKKNTAYYYDAGSGRISLECTQYYSGYNNGDYHYHDMVGPFPSFEKCKRAAIKEFKWRHQFAANALAFVVSQKQTEFKTGSKNGSLQRKPRGK